MYLQQIYAKSGAKLKKKDGSSMLFLKKKKEPVSKNGITCLSVKKKSVTLSPEHDALIVICETKKRLYLLSILIRALRARSLCRI